MHDTDSNWLDLVCIFEVPWDYISWDLELKLNWTELNVHMQKFMLVCTSQFVCCTFSMLWNHQNVIFALHIFNYTLGGQ